MDESPNFKMDESPNFKKDEERKGGFPLVF